MLSLSLLLLTAQPIPKFGPCPLGYYTSPSTYCVPSTPTQPRAIQSLGDCPLGWYARNNYCIEVLR